MRRVALDFGTTNSVIAAWDGTQSSVVNLPTMSTVTEPHLIPSLLYVHEDNSLTAGRAIQERGLDHQHNNRLFRNFKRGIVTASHVHSRFINGQEWRDEDAGREFIHAMLNELGITDIEQLVLTAPVASFHDYVSWLASVMGNIENIRVVDESTAAALGYAVTEPGAIVLVFDFGGGTLDLSLVQLPESKETTGGSIRRLLGGGNRHQAEVIAKAGRNLGGSDVDQWLLSYVLQKLNRRIDDLGNYYTTLLTRCEQAKIALSNYETTDLEIELEGQLHHLSLSRDELNQVLEANGFFTGLRRVVDKVMITARQQGIFREDIRYVLMVGGTSLMPAVQNTLQDYFSEMAVRADKPFTAVVEGALQVALGFGVQDYLVHSYGIRHLDPVTQLHQYDEIIPMGTPYPITKPIEVYLGAAHENQAEVELVVGEIDTDSVAMIEVEYQDGQVVFVAQADRSAADIVPLNLDRATVVSLKPSGHPNQERLKAEFTVDERRQLCVTVTDLLAKQTLLHQQIVTTLR